jgi:chromosome segregation ATPase
MNSVAKITIPIQNLYAAINSPKVLEAQRTIDSMSIDGICFGVNNVSDYNNTSQAIKEANDAIKAIEEARKIVTIPIDQYKKQLMIVEQEATAKLRSFIASAKAKMLEYTNELDRKHQEEQKRIQEQAKSMAALTDELAEVSIQHNHIKGIRTMRKARINGEVDWVTVLGVLFASGNLKQESLLTALPRAMQTMNVDAIAGIEIYEEKIQTITR